MTPELGIIQGFYGQPWGCDASVELISALAPHGYRFYLHAPKGDAYLRRKWQEPHPADMEAELRCLSTHCASLGVRFGVGLSPFELYLSFDAEAKAALASKLAFLDDVGVRDLAVLFDDMRGDVPDLAAKQIEIVHWIQERTGADRLVMCPTYYTDDPVLDRVFGARPPQYLEELGTNLDPRVHLFWTGEEVISREWSLAHVQRVSDVIRRKPFLWDNYPANDGARMSRFLHLRGFTGRRPEIAEHIVAHGVNPALQVVLSRIPLLTLAESYRLGSDYQYAAAFHQAARTVLGPELGDAVREDLLLLQDVGRERLEEEEAAHLRARYSRFDHDGAREILAWLNGDYAITNEQVRTQ